MQEMLRLQKEIVPELVEMLEKRYNILRTIYYSQPIGRRTLANQLHLGERVVRTEISFLSSQGFIDVQSSGMKVTKDGERILENLKSCIHEIKGLSEIEEKLKVLLGLKDVIVVPGNSEEDLSVMKEIGKAAANYLKNNVESGDTIAVTGGSTVKQVIDNFPKMSNIKDVLVVPARGGMGKNVETQANTLAAKLAHKLNGSYKMLHIAENLSNDILETVVKQKEIQDVIKSIKQSTILIYGIGRAEQMAIKRGLPDDRVEELRKKGAVGEAFGCYFDKNSNVVWITPTLGININDIKGLNMHIAVAAGKNKAEAIMSTKFGDENGVLVTDEGAAIEIINTLCG